MVVFLLEGNAKNPAVIVILRLCDSGNDVSFYKNQRPFSAVFISKNPQKNVTARLQRILPDAFFPNAVILNSVQACCGLTTKKPIVFSSLPLFSVVLGCLGLKRLCVGCF